MSELSVVTGTLELHRRSRESWAVGELTVSERTPEFRAGQTLTVVGNLLAHAEPGERLTLHGTLERDARWGPQFRIERQESHGIQDTAGAHLWLMRLDGVGPVLARGIYDTFGAEVLAVLGQAPAPGAPDPLTQVEGIGPTLAHTIRESWGQVGASGSVEDLTYLDGLGLSRFETNTVLRWCRRRGGGVAPREVLEKRPYELVAAKGFGFLKVDKIARKAGMSFDAPARVEAATVHYLGELCRADTFVSLRELAGRVRDELNVGGGLVDRAVHSLAARGSVVLRKDVDERLWVHPADLMAAERLVYRATKLAVAEETPPPPPVAMDVSTVAMPDVAMATSAMGASPATASPEMDDAQALTWRGVEPFDPRLERLARDAACLCSEPKWLHDNGTLRHPFEPGCQRFGCPGLVSRPGSCPGCRLGTSPTQIAGPVELPEDLAGARDDMAEDLELLMAEVDPGEPSIADEASADEAIADEAIADEGNPESVIAVVSDTEPDPHPSPVLALFLAECERDPHSAEPWS